MIYLNCSNPINIKLLLLWVIKYYLRYPETSSQEVFSDAIRYQVCFIHAHFVDYNPTQKCDNYIKLL